MKVLNIAMRATFTEGYTYQDNLLTEYQHKLGHEVIILTTTQCRGADGKISSVPPCDIVMSNGVRLIRILPGNRYKQIIGYNGAIGDIIKDLKPDLIFIHGLSNLIPHQAILYKKKNKDTILVADNHQDSFNSKTNGFPFSQLLFIWRTCWRRWSKYFNHIYGTTSWRRDFAVEYFGIPKDKVDVLMMGADTDKFPDNPNSVRKSIRKDLGISEFDTVFIHGGKMNKNKKTIESIQAFKRLLRDNLKLILFGSISEDIKETFFDEISGISNIIYLGYINSNICHRYFYASDIALFPGLHSVLWEESVACGLPGIYGKYSENDHINICGNCVQLNQSANQLDIANAMQKLIEDKEYFNKMKLAAGEASRYFSYTDIALKSMQP